MKHQLLAAVLFTFIPSVLSSAGDIEFKAPESFPEGVAYNAKKNEYYVTSLRQGTIGRVSPKGKYQVLSPSLKKDPDLISIVGTLYDAPRNRLIACVSDPGIGLKTTPATQKKIARLIVLDPIKGTVTHKIDLHRLIDGDHFCNDIAVDATGNIYVTDSFSPVIYKIDLAYQPTLFSQDDRFKGEGFNLNGIVVHPDGYLLVAKYNDGRLFKVSLAHSPTRSDDVQEITLDQKLPGADGLVLTSNNELVVIQNTDQNKIRKLMSQDGFKSAKVMATVDSGPRFPTTGVLGTGSQLYVLMSHIHKLFAGDPAAAKQKTFVLKEVKF